MSTSGPHRESAMQYALRDASVASNSRVSLREDGELGYLVLRGDYASGEFAEVTRDVLGVTLPQRPNQRVAAGVVRAYGISPDEWMVAVPFTEFEHYNNTLAQRLSGHCAIVDVSGGFTLLELRGPEATSLLHKSGVYDFDRRTFASGRAVQTIIAATSVLVARSEDDVYELIVRRSFADHVAAWLLDAAREFAVSPDSAG